MTIAQNELEALQNAPLFLPRYLQKHISITPTIPTNHLEIIQRWQALMADKTRKHLKGERKLEGDLTIDFFVHILGWHSSTSNNPTLNSQYSITRFIVQQTLGHYLETQQAEIRSLYETGKGEWRKSAPDGMATGRRVKSQI